jgi:hypothetical protein
LHRKLGKPSSPRGCTKIGIDGLAVLVDVVTVLRKHVNSLKHAANEGTCHSVDSRVAQLCLGRFLLAAERSNELLA